MSADVVLFTYGTLQMPEVQQATFGRLLEGWPDDLPGYQLGELIITDAAVLATSGRAVHPIIRPRAGCSVPGWAFRISWQELLAADSYEVADYRRDSVRLGSGATAWAYVAAEEPTA